MTVCRTMMSGLVACILALQQPGTLASPEAAAPAIPGARVVSTLGLICPKSPPVRLDIDGDGAVDSLLLGYHTGPFKDYLSPEAGAQFGLIGAASSMKVYTANQNSTAAGALAGSNGKPLWTFKAGGLIDAALVSQEDGRVYLSSHDDYLRALALRSGEVLWQNNLKANILGLVGSRDDIVAVTARDSVAAYRAADGGVLWQKPIRTAVMTSPNFGFLLADEKTVFVS